MKNEFHSGSYMIGGGLVGTLYTLDSFGFITLIWIFLFLGGLYLTRFRGALA